MALFTVLLEFDGGAYISQLRAASVGKAIRKYAAQLPDRDGIAKGPARRRIADALSAEVAIDGARNVWCCSVVVTNKLVLMNIVQTADAAVRVRAPHSGSAD